MKKILIFVALILTFAILATYSALNNRYGSFETREIKDVNYSLTGEFMGFLMNDGTVWGQGNNQKGELGLGAISLHETTPKPVLDYSKQGLLSQIVQVSVGTNHMSALTESGNVFSWGSFNMIQSNPLYFDHYPKVVFTDPENYLSNIVKIASAGNVTLALNQNGQVYAWGQNSNRLLGRNVAESIFAQPVLTLDQQTPLDHIIDIDASFDHAVAIRQTEIENGVTQSELLRWGEGTDFDYPTPAYSVNGNQLYVAAFAGVKSFAVAITNSNKNLETRYHIAISGDNQFKQIANDFVLEKNELTEVYTSLYPFVYLGSTFNVVVDDQGMMLYRGQIGSQGPNSDWALLSTNAIQALTEGPNQSLYYVANNQIYHIQKENQGS